MTWHRSWDLKEQRKHGFSVATALVHRGRLSFCFLTAFSFAVPLPTVLCRRILACFFGDPPEPLTTELVQILHEWF